VVDTAQGGLCELRDDLLPQEIQGAHDLIVPRATCPEHEEGLIEPEILPAFDASACTVGGSADDDPFFDQLLVAQARQFLAIEAVGLQVLRPYGLSRRGPGACCPARPRGRVLGIAVFEREIRPRPRL
jgi:hypothetical protein